MFKNKETLRKLNRFLKQQNCYSSFIKYYLKADKDMEWHNHHLKQRNTRRISDLIMNGFLWKDTEEKHDYWEKLHRKSLKIQ